MTITDRLNLFIQIVYEGKPARLATALGWKPQAIYKYTKGLREPGRVFLGTLEEKTGANQVWIMTGQGDMFADNDIGRRLRAKHGGNQAKPEVSHPVKIPLMLQPAAAGAPMAADSTIDRYVDLDQFLSGGDIERCIMVRAPDNSMADAGISAGDMLVVWHLVEPEVGDIVVASVNEELLVREFERADGKRLLLSHGSGSPTFVTGKVRIHGVVKFIIHKARSTNKGC